MQVGEAAEQAVGDRDALVDVHAPGVNLLDAKIRDGEFKLLLPYKAPFILGHDLAGVVTRVGSAGRHDNGTSNAEWVRKLGADLVIDYRTQDFETLVHDYDVVLDSQGGDTLARSLRVLKPGGTAIGIAGPPDPEFARQLGLGLPLRLAMTMLSLKTRRAARQRGVRYSFLFMRASGTQLDHITKLFDADVIRPIVDTVYPFDEAPRALAHVEAGRAKGKVVLIVA